MPKPNLPTGTATGTCPLRPLGTAEAPDALLSKFSAPCSPTTRWPWLVRVSGGACRAYYRSECAWALTAAYPVSILGPYRTRDEAIRIACRVSRLAGNVGGCVSLEHRDNRASMLL